MQEGGERREQEGWEECVLGEKESWEVGMEEPSIEGGQRL